jgi:hypothetical protein
MPREIIVFILIILGKIKTVWEKLRVLNIETCVRIETTVF